MQLSILHFVAGGVQFPLWFVPILLLLLAIFIGGISLLFLLPFVLMFGEFRKQRRHGQKYVPNRLLLITGCINSLLGVYLIIKAIINMRAHQAFRNGADFTMQVTAVVDAIVVIATIVRNSSKNRPS